MSPYTSDPNSEKFEKVNFRGHVLDFSLKVISKYVKNYTAIDTLPYLPSMDEIYAEITGKEKKPWPIFKYIDVNELILKYNLPNKISSHNWRPTKNVNRVYYHVA